MKDFFYRLKLPKGLWKDFGLPSVTLGELRSSGLGFEEFLGGFNGFPDDYSISPVFQVLPMGFSWAFYLAQEALRTIVSRVLPQSEFLEDFKPAPELTSNASVAMIYADNGNHISLSQHVADRDSAIVMQELERIGLKTHEHMEASEFAVTLGGTVDGSGLRVAPTPARLRKVRAGLKHLVDGCPISGKQLEHIIGHVNQLFLMFRLLLSTLNHCYAFTRQQYHSKCRLWPGAIAELLLGGFFHYAMLTSLLVQVKMFT